MKMNYNLWVLIGACVTIIGASITAWASYKSGIESGYQNEKLLNNSSDTNELVKGLEKENTILKNKLTDISLMSKKQEVKIKKLTTQNTELAYQFSESTLLLSKSITGGDGFCEMEFLTYPNSNSGKIVAKNHGKYPQHDIKVRITDLEEFRLFLKNNPGTSIPGTDIKEIKKLPPDIKLTVGTIPAGDTKDMLNLISLGRLGKKSSFNIFIEAKNGRFTQSLLYYKIRNKWVKASKINNSKGTTVYEFIDDEFPKKELTWFGLDTN